MSIFYFYLMVLLLIFILIYRGLSYSFQFASVKIKLISSTAFVLLALRYIILALFLLTKSITYLYVFKPFYFLNLLCIPVLALMSIYILSRQDRFKLNYCIAFSIVLSMLYIALLLKQPSAIELYKNIGYKMYFLNEKYVEVTYMSINTFFLFLSILLLGNKKCNSGGMRLIFISALAAIAELMANVLGINIIPAMLIGEVLWLVTADYALYKLKK